MCCQVYIPSFDSGTPRQKTSPFAFSRSFLKKSVLVRKGTKCGLSVQGLLKIWTEHEISKTEIPSRDQITTPQEWMVGTSITK